MPSKDDRKIRYAEIRAEVEVARIKQNTIRVVASLVAVVTIVAILAVAVIKITERPPWLQLALAVFGPSGTVVFVFYIYLRRLNRQIQQALEDRDDEKR